LVAVTTLRRDSRILLRRSRELADQLTGERLQLEQRIAERTRALETTAAVSRRLSTILDQSRLVREVVDQLEEALAYYHVHVYLWDGETDRLKMVGGTGEAGQAMLVAGHALTPSQGLVGRAYSTNKPVIVPDVSVDDNWLPNPLLPSNQAEIAMPITYGDEVLGVLDVQEDEVGGLGPEDAQLLAAIAGQIAVALRNARLVAQIQQQAEQEALINAISRKIIQTTDIDSAMNIVLSELTQALPAHRAVVRLSLEGEATGNGR
jgi:phosphoserine phosphatase RsbU/P